MQNLSAHNQSSQVYPEYVRLAERRFIRNVSSYQTENLRVVKFILINFFFSGMKAIFLF